MKVIRTVLTNIEFDEKEYDRLETEYDLLMQQYPQQTKKQMKDYNINKTLELLRNILQIDL